jgi:hypothetical protein
MRGHQMEQVGMGDPLIDQRAELFNLINRVVED